MKKIVSILLLSAILLTLAACKAPVAPITDPTEEPTAAAPTAFPTEVPTEEPTAFPTEEPTAGPTAVPEPAELEFDDCAELVLRLAWGNGENEVFIKKPAVDADGDLEDGDWVIPEHFNIIDGMIYVYDRFYPHGNGVLECDPATGAVKRLSPDIGEYSFANGEFAVLDGKLIFAWEMYDLATGERTELQPMPETDERGAGVLIMKVTDGKCFAYRAVNWTDDDGEEFFITQATFAYDEYELDMENRMWVLKRRIEMPAYVPHADPPFSVISTHYFGRGAITEVFGDDGALYCFDRYMGMDDAGNHYVDSEEEFARANEGGGYTVTKWWHRIIKLAPDGTPISFVDVYFPDNYIHMWIDESYLVYKVDRDGTVWYMRATESELLIYKISL